MGLEPIKASVQRMPVPLYIPQLEYTYLSTYVHLYVKIQFQSGGHTLLSVTSSLNYIGFEPSSTIGLARLHPFVEAYFKYILIGSAYRDRTYLAID